MFSGVLMPSAGPRVLLFDIETAPILGYVWRLWDQNVALNQIASDWYVLAWAAKWRGEKEVHYMDQRFAPDMENDKAILKGIWKLLDEADIVVTHNGKSFDQKKLYARFVLQGLKPPSSFRHIDTKVLASKHFAFTSNKLEYLTDKLCTKYKKLKHSKFPGFELWKECLKGNPEAWAEMERYNKRDVLALEELYGKLSSWDTSVSFAVYEDGNHVCSCGSSELARYGWAHKNGGRFQRYKCKQCGAEYRSKENAIPKDKRKAMKVGA
jgi:hypothetical protein